MDAIRLVEAGQLKKDRQGFVPGDTVRVHVRVIEGEKERTQLFEGIVIRKRGEGGRASFTVRRISYGVGVHHEPITRDLGDDGRCRDGGAAGVAVDEVALWAGEVAQRDEVGDDQVRGHAELRERLGHREPSRL